MLRVMLKLVREIDSKTFLTEACSFLVSTIKISV